MSDQLTDALNQSSFGTDDVSEATASVTSEESSKLQEKIATKRAEQQEPPRKCIDCGKETDAIWDGLPLCFACFCLAGKYYGQPEDRVNHLKEKK